MKKVLAKIPKWARITLIAVGAFVLGFLVLAGIRFLVAKPAPETHYHANFQVYIDGVREEFAGPGYYEEVVACMADHENNDPKTRTHMHDNVNDVAHVHDLRVTWSDFFVNLGWNIGPDFVRSTRTLYVNTDEKKVTYMLNGKVVDRVDDKVIGDQDKLLVSYGSSDDEVKAQYANIKNNAEHYDHGTDPATCSRLNGNDTNTLSARLNRSFFGL